MRVNRSDRFSNMLLLYDFRRGASIAEARPALSGPREFEFASASVTLAALRQTNDTTPDTHEPSVPWACRGRVLPHWRVRSDQCAGSQSARSAAQVVVVDDARRAAARGHRLPRDPSTHGSEHRNSIRCVAHWIHAGAVRLHRLVVAAAREPLRHGATARRAHGGSIDHLERPTED